MMDTSNPQLTQAAIIAKAFDAVGERNNILSKETIDKLEQKLKMRLQKFKRKAQAQIQQELSQILF